jgi:hypothetical protein
MFDASIRRKLEIALFSEPGYFWDEEPARLGQSLASLLVRAKIDRTLTQSIEERCEIQARALGCVFLGLEQRQRTIILNFRAQEEALMIEVPNG